MTRKIAKLSALAALSAVIATAAPLAFPSAAHAEDKVVATVDGIGITEAELKFAEDEIGRDLGTRERVSQIETEALNKIADSMEDHRERMLNEMEF